MPPQAGRLVMVTGTGGIGWEDALALARAGAQVIIEGRNREKGAEALSRIGKAVPQSKVSFEEVDLASVPSVREFGTRMRPKLFEDLQFEKNSNPMGCLWPVEVGGSALCL